MRKYVSILIVFLLISSITQATVLEDRGFLNKKCYNHLVKLEQNEGTCSLVIAAHLMRRLPVKLVSCPTIEKQGPWFFARFKINIKNDGPSTAEWLQAFEVKNEMIEAMQLREDGLSRTIACK